MFLSGPTSEATRRTAAHFPFLAALVCGFSLILVAGANAQGFVSKLDDASARLHPGSLDAEFGSGGFVTHRFSTDRARGGNVSLDPDGRILVGGSVLLGDDAALLLARFLSDGTPDSSFGTDGFVVDEAFGLGGIRQSDGAILAARTGTNDELDTNVVVVGRYDVNGELDASFGAQGSTSVEFNSSRVHAFRLIVHSADEILIRARTGDDGPTDVEIARLAQDGMLDPTFGADGFVEVDFGDPTLVSDFIERPDGSILAVGFSCRSSCDSTVAVMARYHADGTPDASFGTDGLVESPGMPFTASSAVQSDGMIVVAGHTGTSTNSDLLLARYSSDGTVDESFGDDGFVTTDVSGHSDFALQMSILDDGRILVVGSSLSPSSEDVFIVRYDPDGDLDEGFGDGGIVISDFDARDDRASGVSIDGEGRLLVTGFSGNDLLLARYLLESSTGTDTEHAAEIDQRLVLHQNFPNPVTASTRIEFELPRPSAASLTVYDLLGRRVATLLEQHLSAGRHAVAWEPDGLAGGVYAYRLRAGDVTTSRRMIVAP